MDVTVVWVDGEREVFDVDQVMEKDSVLLLSRQLSGVYRRQWGVSLASVRFWTYDK